MLLALLGYVTAHLLTGGGGPPRCTVQADGERLRLDPEQSRHAATISAVASARRLPDRAVTIALATAMQESGLHNIRRGDRDSLGLFQQRPSQGWGTAEQILDPVYSTGKFFDHLAEVPGYSRLPLTVAAQRVQFSGYPQAYAKHEEKARLLTASLTGRLAASFRCPALPDDGEPGDPQRLRTLLAREFGPTVLTTGDDDQDTHPAPADPTGPTDPADPADPTDPAAPTARTAPAGPEAPGAARRDASADRSNRAATAADARTEGAGPDDARTEGMRTDDARTGGTQARGTSTDDTRTGRPDARTAAATGRAGADPHAVVLSVRATAPGGSTAERGWELAHWAMANATELRIARIAFGDREWRASSSEKGWRTVSRATAHSGESATKNSAPQVRIELAH